MANLHLFERILRGEDTAALDQEFPFYPLDSPGMPAAGGDFAAVAASLCGPGNDARALHYLYRKALYDEQFSLQIQMNDVWFTADLVPGHLLGEYPRDGNGGPRPAQVMVVGKNPGVNEVTQRANFVGESSQILFDALHEAGLTDAEIAEWYATNLVRWPQLDPRSEGLPDKHKRDCDVLLQQELRLVRPKYLLCLGSDASKWLLGPDAGVQSMVGRVIEKQVPLHLHGQQPVLHTVKCMAVVHPAQVYRVPEMYEDFRDQVGLFVSLTRGADLGAVEKGLRHENVYTLRKLRQIVDEIRSDPNPERRIIAVDGEWEGDAPEEPGAYLRTIQFSSADKEGITVVLRHQGGQPAFKPSIDSAIQELKRLCKYDPENNWMPQIGGHFFRADLPWLLHAGLDLRDEYAPPDEFGQIRIAGGWATELAEHAVLEATNYGLMHVTKRRTTIPVYDGAVNDAITDYCKSRGIEKSDLEGFGFLPDWILHPRYYYEGKVQYSYAGYDPDATRRIRMKLFAPDGPLDRDWFGQSSWEPYWINHRASLGCLQMEMNGLLVDNARIDKLATKYMHVYDQLLANFRKAIHSPTFNPNSNNHCAYFLFGNGFGKAPPAEIKKIKKGSKQDTAIKRLGHIGEIEVEEGEAPPTPVTLNLTPIKTTGKRSKLWEDVVRRKEAHKYRPCADKEVLGILGHKHPLAMQLRDVRFISKTLSGPLRCPIVDKVTDTFLKDDSDNYVYSDGIAAVRRSCDNRVHGHISQTKETRRYSIYRPPLQNLSKRRESDYARICGTFNSKGLLEGDYTEVFGTALYEHPIRSIFRAAPGCVFLEPDFAGAELAAIAWLCGDLTMIDHVRRGLLPEDDPDHYDIHGQTACRVFRLDCPPTKSGLSKAGFKSLRIAAKNVNFGVPYGRSAEALSRQCREEGIDVTPEQCQAIIDYYFTTYAGTGPFLAECRRRSQEERWLCGIYGGKRRFVASSDHSVQKEQERQAQNFLIQNAVADAMNVAIYNFLCYQKKHPEAPFKMALQIHDALLFEVPIPYVKTFKKEVLRQCMIEQVPIWPRFPDGTMMPVAQPYYFGLETEMFVNWGEPIEDEDLEEMLANAA